jgi:signal transduction histidine kinase
VLQVKDEGCGMPAGSEKAVAENVGTLGVGIPGMRERLRQLGGTLEIKSTKKGTTVTATVPLNGGDHGYTDSAG